MLNLEFGGSRPSSSGSWSINCREEETVVPIVCYLVTLLNRSELSSFTMAAFSASKLPT